MEDHPQKHREKESEKNRATMEDHPQIMRFRGRYGGRRSEEIFLPRAMIHIDEIIPQPILIYDSRNEVIFPSVIFVDFVNPGVSFGEGSYSVEAISCKELRLMSRFEPEIRNSFWAVNVLDEFQFCHGFVEDYLAHTLVDSLIEREGPSTKRTFNVDYGQRTLSGLQLCVNNPCLIIQLSRVEPLLTTLRWFFEQSDHRFIGLFEDASHRELGFILSYDPAIDNSYSDVRVIRSYGQSTKHARSGLGYRHGSSEVTDILELCVNIPKLVNPAVTSNEDGLVLPATNSKCDGSGMHGTTIAAIKGSKNIIFVSDGRITLDDGTLDTDEHQKIYVIGSIAVAISGHVAECEYVISELQKLVKKKADLPLVEIVMLVSEKIIPKYLRMIEWKKKVPFFTLLLGTFEGTKPSLVWLNNYEHAEVTGQFECFSGNLKSTKACSDALAYGYEEEKPRIKEREWVNKIRDLGRKAIVEASKEDKNTGGQISVYRLSSSESSFRKSQKFLKKVTVEEFKKTLAAQDKNKKRKRIGESESEDSDADAVIWRD